MNIYLLTSAHDCPDTLGGTGHVDLVDDLLRAGYPHKTADLAKEAALREVLHHGDVGEIITIKWEGVDDWWTGTVWTVWQPDEWSTNIPEQESLIFRITKREIDVCSP